MNTKAAEILYILSRKVDDFTRCGIVLFREREEGRRAYKVRTNCVNTGKLIRPFLFVAPLTDPRIKVGDNRSEYDDGQLDSLAPFGPLKGISVNIMCSVTFGRTFCGSSGSSLGCGQSTIFPSSESFNRDATVSPNSMRASLSHGDKRQEDKENQTGTHLGSRTSRPAHSSWYVVKSISE